MNKKLGILDPEGININPLNNKPYSDNYKSLAKKWSNLPIYKKVNEIINQIEENNILLVISGTGSGKSIILPRILLHTFDYEKKIIMILPKQILTKSSAQYAAETLDVRLGEEIGYKFRGEKKYSSDTKILYTTDGTLVAMLMKDPELKEYHGVVLDEAHERRTQTDFLLYLLKQVCLSRENFKLIIMSATVDQQIFSDYFIGLKYENIEVSGKSNYPITPTYLDQPIDKKIYVEEGLKVIEHILKTTKEGDILFFVPSIQETFTGCKKFADSKNDFCVEVFAGMNKEKEELAIDKDLYKNKLNKSRKIIIATNVAESSMTIDGVQYIVDSGYENFGYFDPEIDSKVIEKRMITKAQIKQRMGRAGRTSEGFSYHLYTEKEYKLLEDFPKPLIQTSNIYSECLSLLNLEMIQNITKLRKVLYNFIEPPKENYIIHATKLLLKLGLTVNEEISPLGKLIAKLPLEPIPGLAVYTGYKLNCAREIMLIVSISEVIKNNISELFNKPSEDNKYLFDKYTQAKSKLKQKDSDHYTLLKIMKQYIKLKKLSEKGLKDLKNLKDWIFKNFLKEDALRKGHKYYKKMKQNSLDILRENNVGLYSEHDKFTTKEKILASMMGGYFLNIISKSHDHYKTDKIKTIKISKESWMYKEGKKRVLYTELLTFGQNTNMQICSAIPDKVKNLYNLLN